MASGSLLNDIASAGNHCNCEHADGHEACGHSDQVSEMQNLALLLNISYHLSSEFRVLVSSMEGNGNLPVIVEISNTNKKHDLAEIARASPLLFRSR